MISRRIQFRRIKDKFDDLKRFPLEEYVGYDLPSETIAPGANMELATAVKVRLWKVLQSKFQDHVGVEMLRQRDWTDNRFDRSLDGRIMIGQDESLTGDISPSCQGRFFESLHDEVREEIFEDDVDGGFTLEDYEPIEHDAFDDLLWDENLTVEAPLYFSCPSGEQNMSPNSTPGEELQNLFTKCTQNSFGRSVEYSLDSGSSSICGKPLDELLDVGDQGRYDHSLLDDLSLDEGSQSLDLASDHDSHHEMMMDD